jgi:hypothetical protein
MSRWEYQDGESSRRAEGHETVVLQLLQLDRRRVARSSTPTAVPFFKVRALKSFNSFSRYLEKFLNGHSPNVGDSGLHSPFCLSLRSMTVNFVYTSCWHYLALILRNINIESSYDLTRADEMLTSVTECDCSSLFTS